MLGRVFFLSAGVIFALVGVGWLFEMPWAEALWPFAWGGYRMGWVFLTSVAWAIAAPLIWIGLTGSLAAVAPGALNLAVFFGGMGGYLTQLATRPEDGMNGGWAVAFFICAAAMVAMFVITWRIPVKNARRTPLAVRVAFAVAAVILIAAGLALLAEYPTVFPWPTKSAGFISYGWVFLGASLYFIYAVINPKWELAAGQLLGFLAYDIVLLPPYLALFGSVKPGHEPSLFVYTAVLIVSSVLAIYYLFVNQTTCLWHRPARLKRRQAELSFSQRAAA